MQLSLFVYLLFAKTLTVFALGIRARDDPPFMPGGDSLPSLTIPTPVLNALSQTTEVSFATSGSGWVSQSSVSYNGTTSQTSAKPLVLDIINFQKMDSLYLLNISIGTAGASALSILDTGSSDFWITSVQSNLCQHDLQSCTRAGVYNPSKSPTGTSLHSQFSQLYGHCASVVADLWSDTIGLGSVKVPKQTFGLARTAPNPFGVVGVGPTNVSFSQPPLLKNLKEKGIIDTLSFGIFLNAKGTDTGSIVFGGIDAAKIQGSLSVFPMQKTQGTLAHYIVPLPSFTFRTTAGDLTFGNSSSAQVASLDTGSAMTLLPPDMANTIYRRFNVKVASGNENAPPTIDCNAIDSKAKLTLNFGLSSSSSLPITIPLTDFVVQAQVPSGPPSCIFLISPSEASQNCPNTGSNTTSPGIGNSTNNDQTSSPGSSSPYSNNTTPVQGGSPSSNTSSTSPSTNNNNNNNNHPPSAQTGPPPPPIILGANILRNLYIAFDLENEEIGIAPADFSGGKQPEIIPLLPGQSLRSLPQMPIVGDPGMAGK